MRRNVNKLMAVALSCALAMGMLTGGASQSEAATKVKLSTKKFTIKTGSSKTVSVKNAKGAKITWKVSSKAKAGLKKISKYKVKVTAKKKGTVKLTCQVKKGKKKTALVCKITIKKKTVVKTPTPSPSQAPKTTATPAPSSAATPTATPMATPANLLQAFDGVIEHVGTCMGYNTSWNNGVQLKTKRTLEAAKGQFNSFTLENEMKPDQVMGNSPTTISVEEAKKLGYVIPDSYKESTVLKLNLDTVDTVLKIAYDNKLKMRGHTFLWHQQTRTFFYKVGYNDSAANVSTDVMNARLEMYIETLMQHIIDKEKELTGEAGSIVYCWDVVNEYTHRTNDPTSTSWMDLYGDMGLKPSYVKLAFETAYQTLKKNGLTDKVVLFYNDYNTYEESDNIIQLINFINEGEDEKICQGVGMQSHISTTYPTVDLYGETIAKFAAAGLEIQITELDVKNSSDEEQATYMKALFTEILKQKKAGANLTGITIWGLYDSISWIKNTKPLIFTGVENVYDEDDTLIGYKLKEKPSYTAIIQAFCEYKGIK